MGAYHDISCIDKTVENTLGEEVGSMVEADSDAMLGAFPVVCTYRRHWPFGWARSIFFMGRSRFFVRVFMGWCGILMMVFFRFLSFGMFV